MNNINNFTEIDKINSQLERVDLQKSRLICYIYTEYELYLNLVRDLLQISVDNGLRKLYSDPSIKNIFLNAKEFSGFFEQKISNLIHEKLPLITVEQLKINNIEENTLKEINTNHMGRSLKTSDHQNEKFQYENGFQLKEQT